MHHASILCEPSPHPGRGDQKLRQTATGLEKYCIRCTEWWPADDDFFFNDPGGLSGLFYCCKACYREWQATTKGKSRRSRPLTSPALPATCSIFQAGEALGSIAGATP